MLRFVGPVWVMAAAWVLACGSTTESAPEMRADGGVAEDPPTVFPTPDAGGDAEAMESSAEPDVEAPEPDVEAPEPDVEAPEPDVEAPEPDVEAPTGDSPAVDSSDVSCRADGDGKSTLVFINSCASELHYQGSDIEDGVLAPGESACVDIGSDVEELPSKRYWAYIGEDPGAEHHTLAEFTFNTDFYDFDWYNISHVDAFNLPLEIVPVGREDCDVLSCPMDFLTNCPDEGRYMDGSGELVACVSPERDDADSPVARYFESCDDGYAWSGDDQNGDDPSPVRACAGEDWDLVFCPSGVGR